jgi:hypothetical protein
MENHEILPIPPLQEVFYFLPLIDILKKIQDAVVKTLRVRDCVCPRENSRRTKSKAGL